MFIRHEKSVKEFMQYYPIVSTIVIIHIALWLTINVLNLPFAVEFYRFGVGSNYGIMQGEYWRLITPIFLHGDLMHMLFNSFSLVLFGPALEQMLGKVKFPIAYLGAGIIGNIGTYFLASPLYLHVGASGAIFGLFGMYVYMVALRKDLIDAQSAQVVTIIFVIGLVMTFLRSNINIYAHIFGFIGGFALAPLVLKNVRSYSPWRNVRRYRDPGDESEIKFDPNRWNKKRRIPFQIRGNVIWIILVILIAFGLLSRIGLF
ncbi:rhomboid family intramembrane serine protease [Virgibacillus soli]|uniref:rhomboid family intramembrane serine protease n=1 Tax=Paracerasibacillus soli TaxID=480284 RepID=UPI0035EFFB2F